MKFKLKNIRIFWLTVIFLPPVLAFSQGINISAGGNISASGDATIEITDGSFINNGTFTKGTETIHFKGTSAGTIQGVNTNINKLEITNSAGIELTMNELTAEIVLVNAGGKFTVQPGKALSVNQDFSNSGLFVVNSSAVSNGSFIVSGTSSGEVLYNRYVTGNSWHLISSPLYGTNINGLVLDVDNDIATNTVKYGLAPYNNSTPGWEHFTTAAGSNDVALAGNFISGQGYEILRNSEGTVSFTGTVQTGNVNIGITKNSNAWNLAGNPYTSAVRGNLAADVSNNFITINSESLDDSYEAIYVWDAQTSSYITINHASDAFYVAPGQGFFVYSVEGGGDVDFTHAMQTHQTGDIFKSSEVAYPKIKIIAENGKRSVTTQIIFLAGATTGLDPGFDAGRFSGGDNSFAIFSRLAGDLSNSVDLDIQCLPDNNFVFNIPLGINATAGSNVSVKADLINLPPGLKVFIEDKEAGITTELQSTDHVYSFFTDKIISGVGRFYLITNNTATVIPSAFEENAISVFPVPTENLVRIIGRVHHSSNLKVSDITGRQILHKNLDAADINDIDMSGCNNGIYFFKIKSGNNTEIRKISWVKL